MDISSAAELFLQKLQIEESIARDSFTLDIIALKDLDVSGFNCLQLHTFFDGKRTCSENIRYNGSADVVCKFSSTFFLKEHIENSFVVSRNDACSVVIYITASKERTDSSVVPTDDTQVSVGFFSCTRQLIAMAVIDFQTVCQFAGNYLSVELLGCCSNPFAVGVVEGSPEFTTKGTMYVHCSFASASICAPKESTGVLHEREQFQRLLLDQVQEHCQQEHQMLYHSAVRWWTKQMKAFPHLLTNRPAHSMKLMAMDETGQHRLVCSFVVVAKEDSLNAFDEDVARHPWLLESSMLSRGGVLSTSPHHCARFVSLLPCSAGANTSGTVGMTSILGSGPQASPWLSTFALLSQLQGDVQDHAVLLCSLLLGWGLDVYVALGTRRVSGGENAHDSAHHHDHGYPHVWVISFDAVEVSSSSKISTKTAKKKKDMSAVSTRQQVTFWESLTGQRSNFDVDSDGYLVQSGTEKAHYVELYSLFRHDAYLLNVQFCPRIYSLDRGHHSLCLDLHSASHWSSFPLPWFMTANKSLCDSVPESSIPDSVREQRFRKQYSGQ